MQAYLVAGFERSLVPQTVVDAARRYLLVNDAFCDLVGRTRSQLIGRTPAELTHPRDSGAADRLLADVLSGAVRSGQAERLFAHPDGEALPLLVNLTGVVDEDDGGARQGAITGAVGHFLDLRLLRESEHELDQQRALQAALDERAHDAAFVADAQGRMLYASPAVRTLFGYRPEELVDRPGWDFIHPDDMPGVRDVFAQLIADGGTVTTTFRARAADGSWRWVEETLENLLETPVGGVVCNILDVTDRREGERMLELVVARNQAIVEAAQEGIAAIRNNGQLEYANAMLAEILGLPLRQLYERPIAEAFPAASAEMIHVRLRERHIRGPERYELPYVHPDGSQRTLLVSSTPLSYGEGAFVGSLAMVTDVTEARRVEAELRRAALHDPLTGLPNRTLLTDRLDQLIRRQETGRDDATVAVLAIDLDQFKLVNDTRGHDVGDLVLVEASRRLVAALPPDETVARLGGDTFVVLAEVSPQRAATDLGLLLTGALSEPYVLDGHTVHLSATVGIATTPPHDAQDVLRFAETAMFAAKSNGRSQVRMFEGSAAEEAERAYALTSDLRHALRAGSLSMHYQPIVSLSSGAVAGYEALARWTHEVQGDVSPEVFVRVAERMGLARDLDRWAVQRAITEFAAMRTAGDVPPDAYVAVNLSALHLGDPALLRLLVDASASSGLPPQQIAVEITEGAVVEEPAETVRTLRALNDRGFHIAIDDFGTGYSSMAYLRNFPVTALKIDRMFVADLVTDPDALAIVTSIVQLARAIGVTTTAEGVETMDQALQLRHLGCTTAQGWLWSRALPAGELGVTNRHYPVPAVTLPGAGGARGRQGANSSMADVREEHGLVRLLELQRQGASLTTIAAALNAEGFRSPNGQRWHKMTVARALSYLAPENSSLT